MPMNVGREIAHLQKMTVKQLRARYVEVFGEETNAQNKAWLVRRIAEPLRFGRGSRAIGVQVPIGLRCSPAEELEVFD